MLGCFFFVKVQKKEKRKNDLLTISQLGVSSLNRKNCLLHCGNSPVQPAAALVYLHSEVLNPICTLEKSGGFIVNISAFALKGIFYNSHVEAEEWPTVAAEFVYLECGCCFERLHLHVWEKKGCSVG